MSCEGWAGGCSEFGSMSWRGRTRAGCSGGWERSLHSAHEAPLIGADSGFWSPRSRSAAHREHRAILGLNETRNSRGARSSFFTAARRNCNHAETTKEVAKKTQKGAKKEPQFLCTFVLFVANHPTAYSPNAEVIEHESPDRVRHKSITNFFATKRHKKIGGQLKLSRRL